MRACVRARLYGHDFALYKHFNYYYLSLNRDHAGPGRHTSKTRPPPQLLAARRTLQLKPFQRDLNGSAIHQAAESGLAGQMVASGRASRPPSIHLLQATPIGRQLGSLPLPGLMECFRYYLSLYTPLSVRGDIKPALRL